MRYFLGILLVFYALAAQAQQQSPVLDLSANTTACGSGVTCGSVGTSAQIIVPNSQAATSQYLRKTLTIANTSSTATLSIGYNSSITSEGAGTISIGPGQSAYWATWPPSNAIYGVGSAALNAGIFLGQ